MSYYVGILDGHGSIWGVRIPDLPGVHGGGSSPETAILDAMRAASDWAAHQTAGGHPIPAPRTIETIAKDLTVAFDAAVGESMVMVPLIVDSEISIMANISVDAGQLASTTRFQQNESRHGRWVFQPRRTSMAAKRSGEATSSKAATAAAKTLADPKASKTAKTAAASALTQKGSKEVTSKKAATAAAKTLADPKASKSAKTAAASALTQRPGKK